MTEYVYYAELTRVHGGLTGVVLIVRPDALNGRCVLALSTPKGKRDAVPCTSWVSPEYLSKRCIKVTRGDAMRIHPALFENAKHATDAQWRKLAAECIARAYAKGVYKLAPATVNNAPDDAFAVDFDNRAGYLH